MSTLKIVVRLVAKNEDVDVEFPAEATASDVINAILDGGMVDRRDAAGNNITYQLSPKGANRVINENETLVQAQVQDGDVLLMNPVLLAG
jgi:uncharacterized ubiquitin-like protein YukD